MFPLLSRYLIENWTELLPGTPPPDKIAFIQLPGSRVSTFLVLSDKQEGGDRRPRLVVKIPRTTEGEAYLKLEYENLERILRRLAPLPEMLPSVPKPVSLCAIGGKMVLMLEGLPGSRLHSFPSRGLRALGRVCRWLTDLQVAARVEAVLAAEDVEQAFLEPMRQFVKGSELSPAARAYLGRIGERAGALVGAPFLFTLTHGDFSVSNILLDVPHGERDFEHARVSALDWTKSLEAGLPVRDLFHLLTAYAKGLEAGYASDRITYSLWGGGGYARAVRTWLDDYCKALQIPRWHQGLGIAMEYIYGATDYPWGIERSRKARYLDNFERYVAGITDSDEDRPFALLPD